MKPENTDLKLHIINYEFMCSQGGFLHNPGSPSAEDNNSLRGQQLFSLKEKIPGNDVNHSVAEISSLLQDESSKVTAGHGTHTSTSCHSNSHTSRVKAPKHTLQGDFQARKAIWCRAEQVMKASVPYNLGSKMNEPHKAQKLSQKGKFLKNLFPFWDELICLSCLAYANWIGCCAVCSETVMHGC